jgi:nucleoid DNA-binding protein
MLRKKKIKQVTPLIIPDKVYAIDTYELYKNGTNPRENKVNKALYDKVITDFLKFIAKKVINGAKVHLPFKCGILEIYGIHVPLENKLHLDLKNKAKTRTKLAPDWKKTKELWEKNDKAKEEKQLVFHFNEETNFTTYKIMWNPYGTNIKFSTFYKFDLTRKNKRTVAKNIKTNICSYFIYHKKNYSQNGY